jgi:glyoxylase-like metal-dependent hydrolase (beta-lactamase superfamily II)
MRRARVGNVEIVSLFDVYFGFDPARVWPGAGAGIDAYRDRLEANGDIGMDCLCFLLRADGRTVLVDTGLGPESGGVLLDELREAGVRPEEIDEVIFTHLHGDHTGWNMDRATGEPLFTRARYLVPQGDWDEQTSRAHPAASFTRDIAPLNLMKRMELVGDGYSISPSLTTVHTPGHTPGHLSVAVASDGERGFILGDVVLTTIDVEQPDWSSTFDSDQDVARRTRYAILDRLEAEGALIGAAHLRAPGFGRIARTEGRRYWQGLA